MYVYVVTRICKNEKYGTSIPNLGVHTSQDKAVRHYKSIIQDRTKYAEVLWDRVHPSVFWQDERTVVIRESWINHKNEETEHLKLEKWRIK